MENDALLLLQILGTCGSLGDDVGPSYGEVKVVYNHETKLRCLVLGTRSTHHTYEYVRYYTITILNDFMP